MFSKMRIGVQLATLLGVLVALMLAQGAHALYALESLRSQGSGAVDHYRQLFKAEELLRSAETNFRMQVQEFKNVLLRGQDPADRDRYVAAFGEREKAVDQLLGEVREEFGRLQLAPAPVDELRVLHRDLGRQYREALRLFDPARPETAQAADRLVRGKDRPFEGRFTAIEKELERYAAAEAARYAAESEASALALRATLLGLLAAAVVLSIFLGLRVKRGIVRPIATAVGAAQRVAAGDLTVRLDHRLGGEAGELMDALATMTEALRALLREVARGAGSVADTSEQIAQGNLDLSERTEEQAGTLEETASSMEELTTTVGQNAEHARRASELAVSASEIAGRGGRAVADVAATMGGIAESSRRIEEIIGVIDGIAFQTNILALNAAVEAARAGEQGRGFAVVAGEVRNLARRSAQAAKEVKSLIQESTSRVEAGSKVAAHASGTLGEVVDAARQVSALMAEIAAASREQSVGIEQVNQAMAQMDHVVQQNATLVEEAAAAAEAMKGQAAALRDLVARFRLADAGAEPQVPAAGVRTPIPAGPARRLLGAASAAGTG